MRQQQVPEARPSGIMRAVQKRRRDGELATVLLAVFAVAVVAAALYVAFGGAAH